MHCLQCGSLSHWPKDCDFLSKGCIKLSKRIAELEKEILKFKDAIKKHSQQKGMDACWENDLELWKTIDKSVQFPHESVPGREAFLEGCRQYYEKISRNKPSEQDETASAS